MRLEQAAEMARVIEACLARRAARGPTGQKFVVARTNRIAGCQKPHAKPQTVRLDGMETQRFQKHLLDALDHQGCIRSCYAVTKSG